VEVELCGPNVLMGCTCALQIARAPAMAVLGGNTGALSPAQRQVWYKQRVKGEIPQIHIKCSYTYTCDGCNLIPHVPSPSHPRLHPQPQPHLTSAHTLNPSPTQQSPALPSNDPRYTNHGAPRPRQTPAYAPCPRRRGFPARA
jgi:hypothetical protein